MLAAQAGALAYSFGVYGHATAGNIVYNLRGIFSVLLVWCLGHWFANEERHVGGRVMSWRLAGAGLLLGAIGLVVAG